MIAQGVDQRGFAHIGAPQESDLDGITFWVLVHFHR